MLNAKGYFDTMTQLVKNGKCWTENTFLLRELLISHDIVTRAELDYLDSRWDMYDRLLSSENWQQLAVWHASYLASQQFSAIDWLVLVVGFGELRIDEYHQKKEVFNRDVIFSAIDESDIFDDAVKNTRILQLVCQMTSALWPDYRQLYAKQLLGHVFKKFPQLEKHSANFVRTKVGLHQRISAKAAIKEANKRKLTKPQSLI